MGDVMRNGYVQGEGLGPQKTNWNGERAPTAEEIARDGVTEPRTAAIGSTPEGAKNPLWSAEEFNGTWFFCCIPAVCAVIKQTNVGEDIVKMQALLCLVVPATVQFARVGNSNRFQGMNYAEHWQGGGDHGPTVYAGATRSDEVVEFTSKTFRRNENIPAFAWKVGE